MSGDSTRDFSDVMKNFGVAIVGPGRGGSYIQFRENYSKEDIKKINWLTEVLEGDRVVMHNGQSVIQAVGEVLSKNDQVYQYSDTFGDVDGWDLNHFCYVRWRDFNIDLKHRWLSRSTAQYLYKREVINRIEKAWESASLIKPSHKLQENTPPRLQDIDIENLLISKGLRIQDAENTIVTLNRVRKLANWYYKMGDKIPSSEHEIRAFIVIPLLYSLGWSYQKISVETNSIDILLYSDNQRKNPKILIETKSLFSGSKYSIRQAQNYVQTKHKMLKGLKTVIVTDGIVYWMFNPEEMPKPYAYMNIKEFISINPAYPAVRGVLDFIENIIPNNS